MCSSATSSFVGPRPNVPKEVALYSAQERRLLSIRPGLTDYASIVFSDLAMILQGSTDANGDYKRLVRPWKSRLGLHYLASRSFAVDVALVALTLASLVSRQAGLRGVRWLLRRTGASAEVVRVAGRLEPLVPTTPPGFVDEISLAHLTNH